MTNITCFIFSKDRAFQLDALLRSIYQNCPIFDNFIVLYDASTDDFELGYQKLADDHHIGLTKQENFEKDTKDLLDRFTCLCMDYVCLMTDDSLFFKPAPFEAADVDRVFQKYNPAAISLRLGLNSAQPIGGNRVMKILDYEADDGGVFIYWDRTRYPSCYDLNYPLTLDGNIFQRDTLSRLVNCVSFKEPNDLEIKLLSQTYKLPSTTVSCRHSICTNLELNMVQTMIKNNLGSYPYSLEELNKMYLDNIELDFNAMDFSNVTNSHEDIKPVFVKKGTQ